MQKPSRPIPGSGGFCFSDYNNSQGHIMSDWMGWLLAAGVLVIVELFSATFYLLMIALGMLAGGIAALLGAGMPLQTVAAAIAGVAATLLLRRSRYRPGSGVS